MSDEIAGLIALAIVLTFAAAFLYGIARSRKKAEAAQAEAEFTSDLPRLEDELTRILGRDDWRPR